MSLFNPFFHPLTGLTIFFVFFLFFIFKRSSSSSRDAKAKKLPPSPPKLPIIGNLHQLGYLPHRSLHVLAKRYGPLMLLHLGQTPVVVVSSATAAREIMKTHDAIFSSRPRSMVNQRLLYNYKDIAGAEYGEYWRQMRSVCVLHLLSNRRVQTYRTIREEESALMIKRVESFLEASSSTTTTLNNNPVDLSETFQSLTNDVVCRVVLGRKHGEGTFKETLGELVELVGSFNIGDFVPMLGWVDRARGILAKFDKVAKEIDDFLDEVVEEHANRLEEEQQQRSGGVSDQLQHGGSEKPKNFVDVLLEMQKDTPTGFTFGRISIKAVIMDMFAAGIDTTYDVLEWTMTELLRHPKSMKQLQNEVRSIASKKKHPELINEDDLEEMPYLKAVIKETHRLHPPLPLLFPRESTADATVMGYQIPSGTVVYTNAWSIGRDPASWDEPEMFKPERFSNSSVDFRGHDFELIPFGAGRRGCPGINFATTVNELALANLVNRFDWELPAGVKPEDMDMAETVGLTAHRKTPLLANATLHRS